MSLLYVSCCFSLVRQSWSCSCFSFFFPQTDPPSRCCLPGLSGPKWIKWIRNWSHSHTNSIAWILSNPRWIDSETKEQQHCNWDAWSALSSSHTPNISCLLRNIHLVFSRVSNLHVLPDVLCYDLKSAEKCSQWGWKLKADRTEKWWVMKQQCDRQSVNLNDAAGQKDTRWEIKASWQTDRK